jgi:hypothetical protein
VDKDIDDTRRELPEAAARFLSALDRGDLDKLHQAMMDTAASLREVLEHIAAECRLSYDEMCVISMMAVSAMAEDAPPGDTEPSRIVRCNDRPAGRFPLLTWPSQTNRRLWAGRPRRR